MIVGGVISIVPVSRHLIAEPTIDAFIKMGGLYIQRGDPNKRCEQQDQRWN